MMKSSLSAIYNGEYSVDADDPTEMTDTATITKAPAKSSTAQQQQPTGFFDTAIDVVKSLITSPAKEAENVIQTGVDVANYVDDKVFNDKFIDNDIDIDIAYEPKTSSGKIAQTLGAFATGYVAATKLITGPMQGAKVIKGLKPVFQKQAGRLVAGGVTDFVTGDTSDQRLADVLIENPKLANPVLSWLATNPDDTALEARAKNTVEGYITGAAVDGVFKVFKGIGTALKAGKHGTDTAASLAARNATADKLTNEALEQGAEQGAEAFTAKVSTIDGLTYTTEAAAQKQRKEAAALSGKEAVQTLRGIETPATATGGAAGAAATVTEGATTAGRAKDKFAEMFNYDKFSTEAKDVLITFDKPIQESVGIERMSMTGLADDTTQALSDMTGDIFGRLDDLKAAVSTTEALPKEVAYHTALMQYGIAPKLQQALKQVDDGVTAAKDDLKGLVGRTLEYLVSVKKLYRNVGRTVKAADVLAYMKAEDADSLIVKAYDNPFQYAKETIASMSDDEIISLARRAATANEIGGNVIKTIIDSLPAGNAMSKAGVRKSPLLSSIKKYWYASMLSSPKTQLRNLSGNTVKLTVMPLEHSVYGMAKGAAEGYVNDGLSGAFKGAVQGVADGYYFMQGLKRNIGTAWNMSKVAFSNGTSILRGGNSKYMDEVSPNNIFGYFTGYDTLRATGGMVDKAASKILSLLSGADEFFAQLVYGAEVHTKLMTSLNKSGVLNTLADGKAQREFIEQYLKDNYDNMYREVMLANGNVVKGGAVYKEALEMANDATFQTELGNWGKGFTSFVAKCPPMQFIFPFQKTPINLLKDAFWIRSPWGAVYDIGKAITGKDPEKAYKAFGHLATASLLWYEFYSLVADGKITGGGPKNQVEKAALRESGWQPYALKTENGYLNLSSLEPFGSGAMLLADIAEIAQRSDIAAGDDVMLPLSEAALNASLRFALNRTYLQGISDIVGSANRDDMTAGFLTDTILSFIPNAFKDTAQAINPTIYETRTLVDKAKARLGMMDELAPKTSWLTGQSLNYPHGGGLNAYNPFGITDDNSTLVFTELSKIQGIGNPQKKINGAELTPQEYSDYCRLHGSIKIDGRTLYEALEKVVSSSKYDAGRMTTPDPNDGLLDDTRNEMLVDCINKYRKRAKATFLREQPDIQRRANEAKGGYSTDSEIQSGSLAEFIRGI